ncbi:HU family DNA-binding protein [Desulfonatronovibrio magnus]|uniref:HU family DNA-binding protein n=1 Tax=Desulfonatronovibrio magnus TaxID=698827 RepID=UPI0005EBA164|nr:HU family DNA-binding protein [Desulfonatronovibrio magnus]RQD61836.1 MAG: HU family DNA-binding protein [Desulfonatronovibrio sp. MSAO_Bac4]
MQKTQFIANLAEKTGFTKADADKALNGVLEIITEQLKQGDKVTLTGFGTFSVGERAPRKGRNPQTGDPIDIPAARVPKFKAGKALKDEVS